MPTMQPEQQSHAAAFFSVWDAPPPFTSPPHDAGLAQRVAKLTEFAARNGAAINDVLGTSSSATNRKYITEWKFLLAEK